MLRGSTGTSTPYPMGRVDPAGSETVTTLAHVRAFHVQPLEPTARPPAAAVETGRTRPASTA